MKEILDHVEQNETAVYPAKENIFKIFSKLQPSEIKVLILGEAPFKTKKANGYAYGISPEATIPPSTEVIMTQAFKDTRNMTDSSFESWVTNGVFMLNFALTGEAKVNTNKQWFWFTQAVLTRLSAKYPNISYNIWSSKLHAKARFINTMAKTRLVHTPSKQVNNKLKKNQFVPDLNSINTEVGVKIF